MRRQGFIMSIFLVSIGGCTETNAPTTEAAVFTLCEHGSCSDGIPNGDETGVDCGGTCGPCDNGEPCATDEDCTGVCDGYVCRTPRSCDELHTKKPYLGDGAYTIAPEGVETPFQAYCDMTRDGGGWTLLLKADATTTLGYNSPFWTDDNLLNESDVTLENGSAKYQSFLTLPVSILRGELDGTLYTKEFAGDKTAQEIFAGPADIVQQAPPKNGGNWSYQPYCRRFGVNTPHEHNRTRFGFIANNEQNCDTCDTSIGLGLTVTYSNGNNDYGAGYKCIYAQCSQGQVNTGGNGRLWAK